MNMVLLIITQLCLITKHSWLNLDNLDIQDLTLINHLLCLCPAVLDAACCVERISAISCFWPKSCAFFKSRFLDDESTEWP